MRIENVDLFIQSFNFISFINLCINSCNLVLASFPNYNAVRLRRKFYLKIKEGYVKGAFKKMEKIRIYSLKNEDGVLLPYFMTSTSDEEMKKFSLDYYNKMVDSIKDKQEKLNCVEMLRKCTFVCIAEVDLETSVVEKVDLTLYTLTEFKKEVKPDIEIVEGENGQYEMAYNVSK